MMRMLDRLTTLILRNKGLKVTALLLASVTWFYIRDATSFQEDIRDVPLTIVTPDGWAVQEISAKTVSVTFRGSQADLRNLDRTQIRVQATARVKEGEPTMLLELGRRNVSAPRSVRALYVTPSEVEVMLDRETEKEVRVEVTTVGVSPEGYFIEASGVTPGRVKLLGPERRLADVEEVYTQPLDLAGRIRSFSNSIPLVAPSGVPMARLDPAEVMVNFTITEFTVSREFRGVPVKLLMPPGAFPELEFSPDQVNVLLKGRVNVISNLTEKSVHAFVDAAALVENVTTQALPVEVTVRRTSGVTVSSIEPPMVQVKRLGEQDETP